MNSNKGENVVSTAVFKPQPGCGNDSLNGDYLWSSTNFGEAVTETMTPMTWSVIQFTLDDWSFLSGHPTVGNIGGRPYVNISIFATVFQMLRKARHQLLRALEGTMYMQVPEELEIPLIPLSTKETIASMGVLLHTRWMQAQGWKRLPKYLAHNPDWFRNMRMRINAERSKRDLREMWNGEIKPHVKSGVWTVLGTVEQATATASRLKDELNRLVGSEDAQFLVSNLSSEAELLPSLGPSIGLAKVANGEISQEEHIEQYGHRGPNEFELSAARTAEDPGWLNSRLEELNKTPINTQELFKRQQALFDSAWRRFSSRYPRKAKSMIRRIGEYSHRVRLREEARSEYVRDRWLIRIYVQQVGRLTGLGDDIFFLTLDEMLGLLSGTPIAADVVPFRQEAYSRLKMLPSFPSVIRGHFDPFEWAADPQRRSDVYDRSSAIAGQKSEIKGAAASAGSAEGLARVITNPEESDRFQPGEILVARMTDISWTPIFLHAAAVVTDIGAPLSHAAIICRELGIPAVVGCMDATKRLKTGDRIRVNGSTGSVTILAPHDQ